MKEKYRQMSIKKISKGWLSLGLTICLLSILLLFYDFYFSLWGVEIHWGILGFCLGVGGVKYAVDRLLSKEDRKQLEVEKYIIRSRKK